MPDLTHYPEKVSYTSKSISHAKNLNGNSIENCANVSNKKKGLFSKM